MHAEEGLRARKKRRTREQISDVAWRLFAERGFDAVSVAEIAREADVAEATVFNYFQSKEDLVFARLSSFEDEMLLKVRARPSGESVVMAFGRAVLGGQGLLATGRAEDVAIIVDASRVILGSRGLLARERELWDRFTGSLAGLIAEERGEPADALEAWTLANALIGVQRALVDSVRRELLAGGDARAIADAVHHRGRRLLKLVEPLARPG